MSGLIIDQHLPKMMSRQDASAGLRIPPALQASVDRHRDNLVSLVMTLHRAGFGESQIEAGVSSLVASYRTELIAALASLRDAPAHGVAVLR